MSRIAWWSRSSGGGAAAERSGTQRFFEDFALPLGFAFPDTDDFLAPGRFAARFAAGFAGLAFAVLPALADFVAALATLAGGFAGSAFAAGAAATAGGRGGMRELEVFSGGSGCFRGRPLFLAACPSAMSLSKAALASASSRACWELRSVIARSFSARNRSSGLLDFIALS
jgi:hypothetical protein